VHQEDVAEELAGRGYDDKASLMPPHTHSLRFFFLLSLTSMDLRHSLAYSHVLA